MNDFTKEELKKLYNLVRFDSIEHSSELKERLKNKIQSMIDNYCEHENIVTGAYPRSNPPKKCEACGVLHYDNQ